MAGKGIHIEGLSKRYGEGDTAVLALKDVNMHVAPGEVVDTTGAGDAFCGALAAALARGADRAEALDAALAAGSEAVRHPGAQRDPELT